MKGNITHTVNSPTTPNTANVPAQEPNGSSIRRPLMQMVGLPADTTAIGGGDVYNFTYNQVAGSPYTQVSP